MAALQRVLNAGVKAALDVWMNSVSRRAIRGLMNRYVEKGAIYTFAKFEETDLEKRPQLFRANCWITGVWRGHKLRNMVMPAIRVRGELTLLIIKAKRYH